MKTSAAKLILNQRQSNSDLQIFISEEKNKLGQLLILAEIKNVEENAKKLFKLIIEETNKQYFNSVAENAEKALEDTLQQVNFNLSETAKFAKKDWLNESNILIASVKDAKIHFSKIGKIKAFIIRNKEIINITEEGVKETINPVKVFANIYSGELQDKASIIFLTENVLDYLSQDKIRKICLENYATDAVSILKTFLKNAPSEKSFGIILIKNNDEKDAETQQEQEDKEDKTTKHKKISMSTLKNESRQSSMETIVKPIQNRNRKKISALQITILSAIFITAVLIISISANWKKSEQKQTETTPEENQSQILINNIQSKFIDAQNFLIIGDNPKAQTALKEASLMIQTLPETTDKERTQKQKLDKKVSTQLLLAQNTNLTIPTLLIELPININARELVIKENNLYIYNEKDNNIYGLNLDNKSLLKLAEFKQKTAKLISVLDHIGKGIIFYDSLDSLNEFDATKNNIRALEWKRSWNGKPIAADIYQNRLYIINQEGKLFKYSQSITGFTQEVEWIKEGVIINLTSASDMAIDGSIWILNSNTSIGSKSIMKLFKGELENFSANITPALKAPTRIFTDLNLSYVYILDPATKRVVIINKNGALVSQFTAEEFSDLKDFAVNETSRKIYLLDGQKIFEASF